MLSEIILVSVYSKSWHQPEKVENDIDMRCATFTIWSASGAAPATTMVSYVQVPAVQGLGSFLKLSSSTTSQPQSAKQRKSWNPLSNPQDPEVLRKEVELPHLVLFLLQHNSNNWYFCYYY